MSGDSWKDHEDEREAMAAAFRACPEKTVYADQAPDWYVEIPDWFVGHPRPEAWPLRVHQHSPGTPCPPGECA